MSTIPTSMTVIAIRSPGAPEMLVPEQRPVTPPGEGEVLVKVAAAGVNRPDVMQRMGLYPPPKGATDIPGLEIAGEVVALGAGATRFKLGDQVMALVVGGGYAEYCPAYESHCLPVPAGLPITEAAAVPETFFTVWYNMFERGKLKAGETLLVHGGSSGIGTAAIQLAKLAGADVAVNYKTEDFVAATKAATAGKGADVILDMVGGDYIERNYEAAAIEARVVQIAFQGSPKASVDFRRIMLKRLHHTGSTLRSRSVPDKAAIARAVERSVWPLIVAGKVSPVMDKVFPFRQAADAHARMESSVHIGKIVLGM